MSLQTIFKLHVLFVKFKYRFNYLEMNLSACFNTFN